MATSEQIQAAVEGYVQSFVSADKDRFLGVLAPNVVQEDPVGSTPNRGHEGLERFWESLWSKVSKIEFDAREIYPAGSEGALVFTIVQHTRAGGRVTIDGVDTFQVDDQGRIAGIRGYGKVR